MFSRNLTTKELMTSADQPLVFDSGAGQLRKVTGTGFEEYIKSIVDEGAVTLADINAMAISGMPSNYAGLNEGLWAGGFYFTDETQYMAYNGVSYVPRESTTLPYGPTGDAPDLTFVQPYIEIPAINLGLYTDYGFDTVADMQTSKLLAVGDRVTTYKYEDDVISVWEVVSALTGDEFGVPVASSLYAKLIPKKGVLDHKEFGIIEGDTGEASNNIVKLNSALTYADSVGATLLLSNELDISIDNTFIIDGNKSRIHSVNNGGLLRVSDDADSDGLIAVMSIGVSTSFVSGFSVTGGLKLQFSASLTNINKRGAGTIGFYVGNANNFILEVRPIRAEFGIKGKSVFQGKGDLRFQWCHKGIWLKPLEAGSAGAACTYLDFYVTFDFTIFPFIVERIVYSDFKGFAEAIRQAYDHYEGDETSVILTVDGCSSVDFDLGVEAVQSMIIYNENEPNYISARIRHELGAATEDHFIRDAVRISNVPFAEQAVYSSKQPGTITLRQSSFSGSTVTTAVNDTPVFYKVSGEWLVDIQGGFFEPGANYVPLAGSVTGYTGNGSRFFKDMFYPDGDETSFELGSGLTMVIRPAVSIAGDGTFSVPIPAGFSRIIDVSAYVIRGSHSAENVITLTSATATQWDFATGITTTGFNANVTLIAIKTA